MTPVERFMSKVRVQEGCWEWQGRMKSTGYGLFDKPWPEKAIHAHRWLWCALYGPLPAGLELDHSCDNAACVRPDHLEPVTHVENTRRSLSPLAMNARKTHCKRGHEFTPENTYCPQSFRVGWRKCRTCALAHARQTRSGGAHLEIKR